MSEGDLGTWSYCGSRLVHDPHTHTVIQNEGPHTGMQCNGRKESFTSNGPKKRYKFRRKTIDRGHFALLMEQHDQAKDDEDFNTPEGEMEFILNWLNIEVLK